MDISPLAGSWEQSLHKDDLTKLVNAGEIATLFGECTTKSTKFSQSE